jgi:hypothetical protein
MNRSDFVMGLSDRRVAPINLAECGAYVTRVRALHGRSREVGALVSQGCDREWCTLDRRERTERVQQSQSSTRILSERGSRTWFDPEQSWPEAYK